MNHVDKNKNPLSRWKSPLLLLVLSLLLFESLSGFIIFFFGTFVASTTNLIKIHWLLGILALLPYAIYQWRHYFSVRQYTSQFHYKIGLFTFFTIGIVIVSGFPLIFNLNQNHIFYTLVDMIHIVSSFAFLILLCGHLVLVARITITRINKKVTHETGTLALIGRKILWIPLVISILTLLLISLFNNVIM